MKNIAVILAGGIGTRLGLNKPKQFLKIAGKTVLEHTVDVFQKDNNINEIAIVMNENYLTDVEAMILNNKWTKVKKILNGGSERYESSLSAIRAYSSDDVDNINLIFHDSVRPLVSHRIINDVVKALDNYEAVDVAVPAVDTIIKLKDGQPLIASIPQRKLLNRGQTPQGFKYKTIAKAYELALQDTNFAATDDCGIVVKYLHDTNVYVVSGEERNVKLTYPEDIYLLDKLFQLKSAKLDDNISLNDLCGKIVVVFGGNSGIGKDMVDIANSCGAQAYAFSRSLNNIDVCKLEQIQKALAEVKSKEGHIDYIVDSAAILNKEPLMNLDESMLNKIIDINYKGMVNVSMAAYPYLKQSHGSLLHFTSSSYTMGRAFYAMYSSTKAAVVNFVQAVAEEWGDDGIRVNCINPQRTHTPMRTANFGVEDPKTLLKAEDVATKGLLTLLSGFTGEVVDVKLGEAIKYK
jgi:2-C-methyl-D-erythritol 4-phosphate cytidylyltransferase